MTSDRHPPSEPQAGQRTISGAATPLAHVDGGVRENASASQIPHPPGFRRRRGRNWFFLGLTYASYYLCRYNLSPVANEVMRDLNISKSQFGMINSGRDLLYAVGQMVNGLITDRLGGKLAMTVGGLCTILLNLVFGFVTWGRLGAATLAMLVVIRSMDGYFQAFGAPGFIKINTAWFRRKERGTFAGIFGAMINLGAIGSGQLAQNMATGFVISVGVATLAIPRLDWRYMFILPPVAVVVAVLLLNLFVKNTPEEAGFSVTHDDEGPDDGERVRLRDVFARIASNPTVWIVAGAYFCTGVVRRGVETWYAVYLKDVWDADRASGLFTMFIWGLPITATLGSMASGFVSDRFFSGRRAPVAALLYLSQALLTLVALMMPQHGTDQAALMACLVIIAISMMCNSTHSLLGTAAAMDLGGRKMAGCSSGIIDSFQYYGAIISGFGMGLMFEWFGPRTSASAVLADAAAAQSDGIPLDPNIWFGMMLPFGLIGTGLMTYLWLRHRGKHVVGA